MPSTAVRPHHKMSAKEALQAAAQGAAHGAARAAARLAAKASIKTPIREAAAPAGTRDRIPARIRKSADRLLDRSLQDWPLLDRFMTPRLPAKRDDRVVLSILGVAFASMAAISVALMATRFAA